MTDFFLKTGTVVKHGTSSVHLRSILEKGLLPGYGRHALRKQSEATPKYEAVYVGGLSAYFAALAAHMSFMKEYVTATSNYQEKTQRYFDNAPKAAKEVDVGDVPLSFPVVLSIKLGADIRLTADEDYMNIDDVSTSDEEVWNRWNAGGIDGGVKPEWIKTFEFPRLLTVDDYFDRRHLVEKDVELLVQGAKSVSDKIPPHQMNISSSRRMLSQSMNFNIAEIERFFNFRQVSESSNRFISQAVQAAYANQLSEKHNFTGLEY